MTKLRWKLPINPASHVCSGARRRGRGETICWEYCSGHTPAPGCGVDKMSNVPVKVFMPNLIMLMKPGCG